MIDAQKIILSFSGFDESELYGLRRLLRALGIKFAPNFSKKQLISSAHLLLAPNLLKRANGENLW